KGETSKPLSIVVEDDRQQRAATILRDVAYVIEARFELLDDSEPVAKHYNMFKRRAENGQCFHRPYLGTREFACEFDWVEAPIPESQLVGEEDLGYMLHDMVYSKPEGRAFDLIDGHTGEKRCVEARFFKAKMKNGVIEVPPLPSPAEAE
ncbi:MAG: type I-E CRISPR-associated protein Cas5/CasD, partial [Lacipirellulaceae bacterium]